LPEVKSDIGDVVVDVEEAWPHAPSWESGVTEELTERWTRLAPGNHRLIVADNSTSWES